MIIEFNFENNTQIPSVKVCIHFFGGLCILYETSESVLEDLRHKYIQFTFNNSSPTSQNHSAFVTKVNVIVMCRAVS